MLYVRKEPLAVVIKVKKKLIYTFRIASEYPQDMEGSAAVSLFLMSGVANIRKTFGRYIYFILSL